MSQKGFAAFALPLIALALPAANPFTNTVTSVHCETPGGVLMSGEAPALRLQGVKAENLAWTLEDWRGRLLEAGVWPASGRLALKPLPPGYYRVASFRTDGARLRDTTLFVTEPMARLPDDSPYAIMTALPCVAHASRFDVPWHGGDLLRRDADLLAVLGIPNAREIYMWPSMQPSRDSKPTQPKSFRYAFDLMHARGVKLMPFFEHAPAWTKGDDVLSLMPRDLVQLYRYCETIAREDRGRICAWEFWNEPDTSKRSHEGTWEYAACLKAAYLGFKAGDPATPAVNGAFCHDPQGPYVKGVCANDFAKYTDVMNYHYDGPLCKYGQWVADIRRLMAESGCPADMAIWMTEHNTNQEGNSIEESVRKGYKQHSRAQEAILTEFVAKGLLGMRMQGVARDFYFILTCINERNGTKDWGLTRRDGTVKPAYAALATYMRQLGRARLEGEIKSGGGIRTYLFTQPDGAQTILAWAVSSLDTVAGEINRNHLPDCAKPYVLPQNGIHKVVDTCGMETSATGSVTLTRFPSYISGFRGLAADVKPVPAGVVGALPVEPDEDRRVVVQVRPNPADFELGNTKSVAEMKEDGGRLLVEVWNLDGAPKKGRLSVAGAQLSGVPSELDLPVWGKSAFEARLATSNFTGTMEVTGTFGGKRISRLVMPYRDYGRLAREAERVTLRTSDVNRWKRNTSASEWSCGFDAAEQAVRFDVSWRPDQVDRWFYPTYDLDLPAESCSNALAVAYEVKAEQEGGENKVDHCHVMVVYSQASRKKALFIDQRPPTDKWDKRVVSLPLDGEDIVALRFGCGPQSLRLRYWLRNVTLLRARKTDHRE